MQDVTFTWKGTDYIVPKNKMIGLINSIEDVVTLGELHEYLDFKKAKFGKVAEAYANAITYAGCRVSPEEVHETLFLFEGKKAHEALFAKAIPQLISIVQPMVAPEHLQEKGGGSKKAEAATPAADSSKRRTKRQSPGD